MSKTRYCFGTFCGDYHCFNCEEKEGCIENTEDENPFGEVNIIKKNKMMVIKGSSINADTIEIRVENGSEVLFNKKYFYGYDVSWKESFATKEKPFDVHLTRDIAKEFDIEIKDIEYAEGTHLFKEIMEKERANEKI